MARFPKKQKLCSEKAIDRLFETGESISEAPLRAVWGLEKNKVCIKKSCPISETTNKYISKITISIPYHLHEPVLKQLKYLFC